MIRTLITQEQIQARVRELGAEISRFYAELPEPLVLICVLKGSVIFLADLCRAMDVPLELEFMGTSSYGETTVSSGVVRITQDLSKPIAGKHVLLIEDIVDTGLTAKYLIDVLSTRGPKSLRLCALLDKPTKHGSQVNLDFRGFTIPDEFVIGYGLDLAEIHRNLPFVGVVEQD